MSLKRIFRNDILKGGLLILLSSLINRLIIYALVPVYTKVLLPSELGIIGYYQVTLLIIQIVISLGLFGVQTRLYHDYKHDKIKLGELLFNINILVFLIGSIISIINFLLADILYGKIVTNDTEITIIKILPFTALFQALNININNFRLVRQEFLKLFVQKVLESIFIACAILFFLFYIENGAISDFSGTLVGTFICLLLFTPSYFKHFTFKLNVEIIKVAILLGLPLILHTSANILVNIGDRYIIKYFLDNSTLGVYTIAFQIGQIMSVVATSLNQAWQAKFLKTIIGKEQYNPDDELLLIATLNGLVGVLITVSIQLGFDLVFDLRYAEVKKITPVIIVSYLLNFFYFVSSSIIFINKRNGIIASITLITLAFNTCTNLLLIPKMGIMGAAVATLLTMLFRSIITILVSERIQSNLFNYRKVSITILITSCLILSTLISTSYIWIMFVLFVFSIYLIVIFTYYRHRNKRESSRIT